MARPTRGQIHEGTLSTTIADRAGARTVEMTYFLTLDLDSIVRQLAPVALLVNSSTKRTTRLNEAVTLTVAEVETVET